jgi:hypothetical protein
MECDCCLHLASDKIVGQPYVVNEPRRKPLNLSIHNSSFDEYEKFMDSVDIDGED